MRAFPETVPYVDLERYSGRWFEVASTRPHFQTGCTDVEANYQLLPDGTVQVVNRCLAWPVGGDPVPREVVGYAIPVDNTNAALGVDFGGSQQGMYLVLALDRDYQWVMVGSATREDFWILSRTRMIDPGTYAALLFRAAQLGYPVGQLEGATHTQEGTV